MELEAEARLVLRRMLRSENPQAAREAAIILLDEAAKRWEQEAKTARKWGQTSRPVRMAMRKPLAEPVVEVRAEETPTDLEVCRHGSAVPARRERVRRNGDRPRARFHVTRPEGRAFTAVAGSPVNGAENRPRVCGRTSGFRARTHDPRLRGCPRQRCRPVPRGR
jgi:hypothetical protein